jgi:hypothetical protein
VNQRLFPVFSRSSIDKSQKHQMQNEIHFSRYSQKSVSEMFQNIRKISLLREIYESKQRIIQNFLPKISRLIPIMRTDSMLFMMIFFSMKCSQNEQKNSSRHSKNDVLLQKHSF